MWQKCPICLGTGIDKSNVTFNKKNKCPTCFGSKIINTLNGKPPLKISEKINIFLKSSQDKEKEYLEFLENYKLKLLEKGK